MVDAFELGIRSSKDNEIEVASVKEFLEITSLQLARCLFKLENIYSIIN